MWGGEVRAIEEAWHDREWMGLLLGVRNVPVLAAV